MDLQLQGKRAIVTGGSKGLGRAIAQLLAEEGCDVAVAARGRDQLETTAREIAQATGRRIIPIAADMADDTSVSAMVDEAARQLGGVDILINNAATPGGGAAARVTDVDLNRFFSDMNIKTGGLIRAAAAASPHMIANGWGRIVNIGGLAARVPGNYNSGARCATISALTKNLAEELGRRGVAAICVHPYLLHNPDLDQSKAAANIISEELMTHADIACLVAFLCSPRNRVINGETIQATGGYKGVINY